MPDRKAQNISYVDFVSLSNKDISSNKLEIAQFQRNYVWGAKHIKSLIDSINENDEGFYLGNIVIQRSAKGNSGYDYVVDGQQRLVTLSLIANALKEKVTNKQNLAKCKKIINFSEKSPRIRFSRKTLDKAYRATLSNRTLPGGDDGQLRFCNSYKIIVKEIDKLYDKDAFFKKIAKIEFVIIKCSSTNSVYQLFESLNSKGQKLSPVELTKNALLGDVMLGKRKIDIVNANWEKIETSFEKKGSKIIWFSKFLRHDWFSIGGYISENRLFGEVKNKIKNVGAEIFSEQLLADSAIYLSLRKAELKKSELSSEMSDVAWKKAEHLIGLIKILQLDQVYAVLLSLVKYGKRNPDYFEKDKFFNDINKIWSFLVLIKYSKVSPASYEKIFANFCLSLHSAGATSFDKKKKIFFASLKEKIPNKHDFVKKICEQVQCTGEFSKDVNYKNDNVLIRLLLLTYLSEGREVIGDYSNEHIIPKGNLKKWNGIGKEFIDDIEKIQRYKLGNLTLLKDDKVGNEDFDTKFKHSYGTSIFTHNKELNKYKKLFNSKNPGEAVEKRGVEIATELYRIYSTNL